MLCAVCVSIFATDPGSSSFPSFTGRHHASIANLKAAAKQGCYLCSEVILDYDEELIDDDGVASTSNIKPSPISFELRFYSMNPPKARLGNLSFESADGKLNSASYELVYTENLAKPARYDRYLELARSDLANDPSRVRDDGFASSNTAVPVSTGDPAVIDIAARWLKSCLENHTKCEASGSQSTPTWYPKRLLDLVTASGEPRLAVTVKEPPTERYATLSHCWGTKPICVLNSDNMTAWTTTGIPRGTLTKTFEDAVAVCRMLSMRYLWIDSLCIQQAGEGSAEDWKEHAIAMRQVYTSSLVNIAAARASAGEEGAFSSRTDTFLRPQHVLWRWPANFYEYSKDPFWTIRKSQRHGSFSIRTLPLYTRGWVVQERFLTSRVIHFGDDRIFWECNESGMVEESYPKGFRESCPEYDNVVQWSFDLGVDAPTRQIAPVADLSSNTAIWQAWQQMINEYTRCDLSFPDKDMLIAIAGIAEKFGQFYDHHYVAGHFQQHLPFDLLWQNKGELAEVYRAPTWSWASRDEGVQLAIGDCPYCDLCCNRFASLKNSHVDLVDENFVYGQITHAEITLTGYCIPCTVEPAKCAGTGLRQEMVLYSRSAHDDATSTATALQGTHRGEADLDNEHDSLSGFTGGPGSTAWALPIMEMKPENADEIDRHRGIVIKKVADGKYARVGIYRVREYIMGEIAEEDVQKMRHITMV